MKTKYFPMFIALLFICGITTVYYTNTIAEEIIDTGVMLTNETYNISADNTAEEREIINTSEESTIESSQMVSMYNSVEEDALTADYLLPNERIYISDDGAFQAFVSSIDRSRYNNIEVTVVDNSSGAELIIPLSIYTLHFLDLVFIENSIAITGYVNPSLSILEIFSLDDGERLSYREGRKFTFDSNNELYYVQVTFPHFSTDWGNDRIVNGRGDVLYESEYGVSIYGELHIDEYTIGFFEDSCPDTYKIINKL